MGGTAWTYFVPYDDDVGAALERLRHEVFLARAFSDNCRVAIEEAIAMTDDQAELRAAELTTGDIETYRSSIWPRLGALRPEPRSVLDEQINRVLQLSLEEGTHSILDIAFVSDEPDYNACTRIPPGKARWWFGSDRPTRRDVEGRPVNNGSLPKRWHAWVFDVYDGGWEPVELCFLGNTGD